MKILAGSLIHSIHGKIGGGEIHYSKFGDSLQARKINPHVSRLKHGDPATNPCIQWTYADAIWQSLTPAQHAEWQAAIKAPGKSNYDIWMMEALWHCQQYEYLPDHPSVSGGYSHGPLNPGLVFPPTPDKEEEEPPWDPPPPGPPDYFDCEMCWFGSYQKFWLRLTPEVEGCWFEEYFEWTQFEVIPTMCVWRHKPVGASSWFSCPLPPTECALYDPICDDSKLLLMSNLATDVCLGGIFDNILVEPIQPCPHGNHEGFAVQIIGT